jgi:hypothetical protein
VSLFSQNFLKVLLFMMTQTYTVRQNDTLRNIAQQFYTDTSRTLLLDTNTFLRTPERMEEGWLEMSEWDDLQEAGFYLDLQSYHNAFDDGVRWRLTKAGVEIEGSGVERSHNPAIVTKIWENYAPIINRWAEFYDIPCALIVATIATESHGSPKALKIEQGYMSDVATPHRINAGLMQTSLLTARSTLDKNAIDHTWLFKANNSIQAGTSYLAEQRQFTDLDPPKVTCAYRLGELYYASENRWRILQMSNHCDRFVKWFNDAVVILAEHPLTPSVPYERYFI